MKAISHYVPIVLVLLFLAGCGDDSDTASAPAEQVPQVVDLDDPLGGFTLTDEEVAFGDETLAASVDTEVEIDDSITDSPEYTDLEGNPTVKVYPMTVTWGILSEPTLGQTGDPLPVVQVTDWSGSIRVSRGGIALQRTISFDRNDGVTMPRPDIQRIDWISQTTHHFDGLRLLLLLPLEEEPNSGSDSLWFETEAYSQVFVLPDDFVELDEIVNVGDEGNQVRFQAYEPPGVLFQAGFLAGRWGTVESDRFGQFAGRWVDRRGVVGGFLRGVYGLNRESEPVLFGKFIHRDGRFAGILRGTWSEHPHYGPGPERYGQFTGAILQAQSGNQVVRVGTAEGRWRSVPKEPGYFDGRYCFGCN